MHTPAISRLAHRRALLVDLIASLTDDNNVPDTEMRRAMTKNEYAAYRSQLSAIQPLPHVLPSQIASWIKRYEKLLRKADALNSRAENKRTVRMVGLKHARNPSLYQQAESAYEHAIEILHEMVSQCPGVASFFDRPVVFRLGDEPTLDPDSAPRLHTSHSPYALHRKNGRQSPIFRLKLEALRASLTELVGGTSDTPTRGCLSEELDIDLSPADARYIDLAMLDDNFL